MKKIFDIDFLGMAASAVCLVHCLFLPWIIAFLGTYFGSMFESPYFHDVMLVVAILIGLPVFILSYRKYKSKLILVTGIVGLGLTTFGTVKNENCCPPVTTASSCEDSACADSACASTAVKDSGCEDTECEDSSCEETPVSTDAEADSEVKLQGFNTVPLGVSFLIIAHFLNFRKRKTCKNECCS